MALSYQTIRDVPYEERAGKRPRVDGKVLTVWTSLTTPSTDCYDYHIKGTNISGPPLEFYLTDVYFNRTELLRNEEKQDNGTILYRSVTQVFSFDVIVDDVYRSNIYQLLQYQTITFTAWSGQVYTLPNFDIEDKSEDNETGIYILRFKWSPSDAFIKSGGCEDGAFDGAPIEDPCAALPSDCELTGNYSISGYRLTDTISYTFSGNTGTVSIRTTFQSEGGVEITLSNSLDHSDMTLWGTYRAYFRDESGCTAIVEYRHIDYCSLFGLSLLATGDILEAVLSNIPFGTTYSIIWEKYNKDDDTWSTLPDTTISIIATESTYYRVTVTTDEGELFGSCMKQDIKYADITPQCAIGGVISRVDRVLYANATGTTGTINYDWYYQNEDDPAISLDSYTMSINISARGLYICIITDDLCTKSLKKMILNLPGIGGPIYGSEPPLISQEEG